MVMKAFSMVQVLGGLVFAAVPAMAVAQSCESVLQALEHEKGLSLVQKAGAMQVTHYKASERVTLDVNCMAEKPSVGAYMAGPIADQPFYALVGRAGSLISKGAAADIIKAAKQCRKEALQDESEMSTVEQKGLAIECQAFVRDGGSTTITVFAE